MGCSDAAAGFFAILRGKTWTLQHANYYTQSPHAHGVQEKDPLARKTERESKVQTQYGFLQSDEPQQALFLSIKVIKWRALAGGRLDCASDPNPGGVGRPNRGAAGEKSRCRLKLLEQILGSG